MSKEDMEKEIVNGEIHYGRMDKENIFYLPHSCDQWVIGNLEEAKKFADNLLETIKEVEELTSYAQL
mgnify:CR=1 FL=1